MNFDIKTNGDRVEPLEISPNSASNVVPANKPNDHRIQFVTKYAVSICGFSRLAIIVRACFCLKVAHRKNLISYKI
jgi:hypothetical protein